MRSLSSRADDVVDGDDLGILLNTWSGDDLCTVWPSFSCPTSELGGGVSPADAFDYAMTVLGFTDADDLAAWFATADGPSRDAVLISIMSIMVAVQSAPEE